jgi:phosphoribosylaminoimidazole-succinocarboxamide synthase
MNSLVVDTKLKNLKLFKKGKVRDIYEYDNMLLIVATDRISAFDVVLANGIPQKGEILTALSLFWFDFCKHIISNHVIKGKNLGLSENENELIKGRSMLVKKAEPIKAECIVRGYLSGTAWKEYVNSGKVSGITLPSNLKESQKLEQPIFTPSTKSEKGHDINITFTELKSLVGKDVADKVQEVSLKIYKKASAYAESKGIIIADTKFEFGLYYGQLLLIDEVLTPDSSRFWSKSSYAHGKTPPSFDKQFVRDYLETLSWNKTPPAPELPADIIEETRKKYLEAERRLLFDYDRS